MSDDLSPIRERYKQLRSFELQAAQALKELKTVNAALNELQVEREKIQARRVRIESDIQKATTRYAKLCAQRFAQRFLATLPREIRDIIYELAIRSSVEHTTCAIVPRAHRVRWVTGHSEYGPFSFGGCRGAPTIPHFLQKQWFGDHFACEAAIAFYRSVAIVVTHQEDLDSCLNADILDTGIIPRQYIKSLDLTLTSEAYDVKGFDYEIGRKNEKDTRHLVKAVRWLDSLLGLPEPTKVRIQVWVKATSPRAAAQLEELLTPVVMKMRGRNCDILVMHDLDTEYGPGLEYTFEFPRVTPLVSSSG